MIKLVRAKLCFTSAPKMEWTVFPLFQLLGWSELTERALISRGTAPVCLLSKKIGGAFWSYSSSCALTTQMSKWSGSRISLTLPKNLSFCVIFERRTPSFHQVRPSPGAQRWRNSSKFIALFVRQTLYVLTTIHSATMGFADRMRQNCCQKVFRWWSSPAATSERCFEESRH